MTCFCTLSDGRLFVNVSFTHAIISGPLPYADKTGAFKWFSGAGEWPPKLQHTMIRRLQTCISTLSMIVDYRWASVRNDIWGRCGMAVDNVQQLMILNINKQLIFDIASFAFVTPVSRHIKCSNRVGRQGQSTSAFHGNQRTRCRWRTRKLYSTDWDHGQVKPEKYTYGRQGSQT